MTKTRLEAFSDGIIAIAATLLVLELHVPEPGQDVWGALRDQGPAFAGYLVSFLTVLILWVNHHAMFHAVVAVDRALLFLNGLLLLGISFVSFPTAVLGRALQAHHDERAAAVFYALSFAATSACFTALWGWLHNRPQLLEPAARDRTAAALRRSLTGPALYLLAAGVATIDARIALVVVAGVAAFFALSPRQGSSRSPG